MGSEPALTKSKRVQIIVVATIVVVAAGMYWFFIRRPDPLAGTVRLVCVATGERFSVDTRNLPSMFPAKNPKTGEYTLLPMGEEDGRLMVSRRYRDYVRDPNWLGKVNRYVDPNTLEVLASPRQ